MLKQKRKNEAVEKRKEKENIKRLKETQALQKNKESVYKQKTVPKKKGSPIEKPGSSQHVTPAKKGNKQSGELKTSLRRKCGSYDDCSDSNFSLSNKNSDKKQSKFFKKSVSPIAGCSHQVTPARKRGYKESSEQNTYLGKEVGSDDDSPNSNNQLSIVDNAKRVCLFDTDSDDSV